MADQHRWRVTLEGHTFDLEDLPLWLAGSDPTVKKIDGEYALLGASLDVLGSADDVRRTAIEMVGLINALGRIVWSEFQPIKVGNVVHVEPEGKRRIFAFLEGKAKGRSKVRGTVTKAGGSVPAPSPASGALRELIDRSQADTKARRLVEILSHAELTWSDLYKAVEVVKEAAGSSIHENGWASKKEIERLERTAQSYDLLGREARHAKSTFKPPSRPLSFSQAKAVVLRIAGKWLKSLPLSPKP